MAVYLFFDEAGNLDFSPSGTKFYVFGALTTREPSQLFRPLSDLRYRLIAEGTDIERFHASEDRQQVRDLVFDILHDVGGFEFDSVIVRKDKVGEAFKDDLSFYPHFANFLLQGVFARYGDPDEQIVIITDRLPVKKKKKAFEKAFKSYIRKRLGRRRFTMFHHASASHTCLQAADYCNWAIYKKWKDAELRPYGIIKRFVRSEADILADGT